MDLGVMTVAHQETAIAYDIHIDIVCETKSAVNQYVIHVRGLDDTKKGKRSERITVRVNNNASLVYTIFQSATQQWSAAHNLPPNKHQHSTRNPPSLLF